MRKETIELREKIILSLWNKEPLKKEDLKHIRLTMDDIGEIFGQTTGNIHRVIKKDRLKSVE